MLNLHRFRIQCFLTSCQSQRMMRTTCWTWHTASRRRAHIISIYACRALVLHVPNACIASQLSEISTVPQISIRLPSLGRSRARWHEGQDTRCHQEFCSGWSSAEAALKLLAAIGVRPYLVSCSPMLHLLQYEFVQYPS